MNTNHNHAPARPASGPGKLKMLAYGALLASAACGAAATAAQLEVDNPDLTVRWDNTIKFSSGYRVGEQSATLVSCAYCANIDDGDRNFNQGFISNRVDLLSEFDAAYKDVGLRISAAAWYDAAYNRGTDHSSPATWNMPAAGQREFTATTRRLHGRDAEILDAFVYTKGDLGNDKPFVLRAGRHTLLYGEAMFFASNSISGGQAPVDTIKAQSVPNSTAKEISLPTGQVSGQVQLSPELTVGGYYQYEWRANRLPAVGSYFSVGDFRFAGAEVRLQSPANFTHGRDIEGADTGQYGMQVKYSPEALGTEFGFYAIRYNDRGARLYNYPASRTFAEVYPNDVKSYGVSFSRSIGDAAVAGEASLRTNAPLVGPGSTAAPGQVADNQDHALYPIGRTAHLLLNATIPLPRNALWDGGFLLGELAWNRVLSISKNPQTYATAAERDAWGLRVVLQPSYQQVLPQLDLSLPVGLSYFPKGKSGAVGNFGVDKGGTYNVGVQATYATNWRASLTFNGFYGPEGTFTDAANQLTFKQALKDRNFVALSIQRTF